MRVGHRFCGRCGRELKPAARFCSNCGHSVPGSTGQAAAEGSRPDLGAYAPTATSLAVPGSPAAPAQRQGGAAGPGPGGPAYDGPGRPPPGAGTPWAPVPPGAGAPGRGTPPPAPRRPAFVWPLVIGLAVLLAGGGTAAGLFLTRSSPAQAVSQSPAQPVGQGNGVASSPADQTGVSTSPPAPPTQVDVQGMSIGIASVSTDQDATDVANTLATYFAGINNRNYRQAWATYTPGLQASVPYSPFARALQTSQDNQVVVQGIQHDGNGNIEADVAFQSRQAGAYGPDPGQTCTDWSLDYHMVPTSGTTSGPVPLSYLIDKVTPIGAGHASC